ncbi:MAG: SRPBCC family protein [Ilumatobacteraceae bacterium]
MDVAASLTAPCAPEVLFSFIDRLDDYPTWMPLVHSVEADAPELDGRPAWRVELRARLGPFARSKRLRMVRAGHDPARGLVRFERLEHDGRAHSPWVLEAAVSTDADGSLLRMDLHYGGALWTGGVMERVLGEQIVAGRERLLERISAVG